MDMSNLLKNYGNLIFFVITVVFGAGIYCTKINDMSGEIEKNSTKIATLEKTVYILVGNLQQKYPGIDVKTYVQTSIQHGLSTETTIAGLSVLKDSPPRIGKLYLMQHQGFTEQQASGIFFQSNPSSDNYKEQILHK